MLYCIFDTFVYLNILIFSSFNVQILELDIFQNFILRYKLIFIRLII